MHLCAPGKRQRAFVSSWLRICSEGPAKAGEGPAKAGHYGRHGHDVTSRSGELESHLAHDRRLEDVPENVLLNFLIEQVRRAHERRDFSAVPFHTEAAVDHRVRIRKTVIPA